MKNTYMISRKIVIYWEDGEEHIDIDVMDLDAINEIRSSRERWINDASWHIYHIISAVKNSAKTTVITLSYSKENNLHLKDGEAMWGETVLKIKQGQKHGLAIWKDNDNEKNNTQVNWECVENQLANKKRTCKKSYTQRNQTEFKRELLSLDKQCAITGEKTKEVLEAAHIIPVIKGGNEILENGIILRADIHRLFDADKFHFSADGNIVDIREVSLKYQKILNNAHINETICSRIKDSLQYTVNEGN